MRGAGGSDLTAEDADYHPASYARDLVSALDALEVARFTLVGHSLGTIVASHVARDHRHRLDALVQMAGPAHDRTGAQAAAASATSTGSDYRKSNDAEELEH